MGRRKFGKQKRRTHLSYAERFRLQQAAEQQRARNKVSDENLTATTPHDAGAGANAAANAAATTAAASVTKNATKAQSTRARDQAQLHFNVNRDAKKSTANNANAGSAASRTKNGNNKPAELHHHHSVVDLVPETVAPIEVASTLAQSGVQPIIAALEKQESQLPPQYGSDNVLLGVTGPALDHSANDFSLNSSIQSNSLASSQVALQASSLSSAAGEKSDDIDENHIDVKNLVGLNERLDLSPIRSIGVGDFYRFRAHVGWLLQGGADEEYESLTRETAQDFTADRCVEALAFSNREKNRYVNVLPFDFNRVRLGLPRFEANANAGKTIDNNNSASRHSNNVLAESTASSSSGDDGDYINATYISTEYDESLEFVFLQGAASTSAVSSLPPPPSSSSSSSSSLPPPPSSSTTIKSPASSLPPPPTSSLPPPPSSSSLPPVPSALRASLSAPRLPDAVVVAARSCPFIATQGPKENTLNEFWRMVYEQSCYCVVMLGRHIENNVAKFAQYWPEKAPIDVGDFVVSVMNESLCGEFIRRVYVLSPKDGRPKHVLLHWLFTAFPDHGIPTTTHGLTLLVELCELETQRRHARSAHASMAPPPVIVHCSAGLGRTGVYCSIAIALRKMSMAQPDAFALRQSMLGLRRQRAGMLQTRDQLLFCYLAVLDRVTPLFTDTSLNVPWYHADCTKETADRVLSCLDVGAFLARPSSAPGSLAICVNVISEDTGELSQLHLRCTISSGGFQLQGNAVLYLSLAELAIGESSYLVEPVNADVYEQVAGAL